LIVQLGTLFTERLKPWEFSKQGPILMETTLKQSIVGLYSRLFWFHAFYSKIKHFFPM